MGRIILNSGPLAKNECGTKVMKMSLKYRLIGRSLLMRVKGEKMPPHSETTRHAQEEKVL